MDDIDETYDDGFEAAKLRVRAYLLERADWLRSMYLSTAPSHYLHDGLYVSYDGWQFRGVINMKNVPNRIL